MAGRRPEYWAARWQKLRAQRLELDRESKKIKEKETLAKGQFLGALLDRDEPAIVVEIPGAGWRDMGCYRVPITTVTNFLEVVRFVAESEQVQLLDKRVHAGALEEYYFRTKKGVPGVKLEHKWEVFNRKH